MFVEYLDNHPGVRNWLFGATAVAVPVLVLAFAGLGLLALIRAHVTIPPQASPSSPVQSLYEMQTWTLSIVTIAVGLIAAATFFWNWRRNHDLNRAKREYRRLEASSTKAFSNLRFYQAVITTTMVNDSLWGGDKILSGYLEHFDVALKKSADYGDRFFAFLAYSLLESHLQDAEKLKAVHESELALLESLIAELESKKEPSDNAFTAGFLCFQYGRAAYNLARRTSDITPPSARMTDALVHHLDESIEYVQKARFYFGSEAPALNYVEGLCHYWKAKLRLRTAPMPGIDPAETETEDRKTEGYITMAQSSLSKAVNSDDSRPEYMNAYAATYQTLIDLKFRLRCEPIADAESKKTLKKNFKAARVLWEACRETYPEYPNAHLNLAGLYLRYAEYSLGYSMSSTDGFDGASALSPQHWAGVDREDLSRILKSGFELLDVAELVADEAEKNLPDMHWKLAEFYLCLFVLESLPSAGEERVGAQANAFPDVVQRIRDTLDSQQSRVQVYPDLDVSDEWPWSLLRAALTESTHQSLREAQPHHADQVVEVARRLKKWRQALDSAA